MTEDKFSKASAATKALARDKHAAKSSAVISIRLMLEALHLTLDGATILNLPNLATSRAPYRGLRVLCKSATEKLPRLSNDDTEAREALCLSSAGKLVFARLTVDLTVEERLALESEYLAEWPQDVAESILAAVDHHLLGCEAAINRYTKLRKLSDRLIAALEGPL